MVFLLDCDIVAAPKRPTMLLQSRPYCTLPPVRRRVLSSHKNSQQEMCDG